MIYARKTKTVKVQTLRIYEPFSDEDKWFADAYVPVEWIEEAVAIAEEYGIPHDAPGKITEGIIAIDSPLSALDFIRHWGEDMRDPAKHAQSYDRLRAA